MHDAPLISTIAVAFTAAWLLGLLTQRLGLSPIVGYLTAGVLIGPHTPGFVGDVHLAQQLAEVGVILLMFGVGLQFHVKELLAVRRVAVPGALVQVAVSCTAGALVAGWAGWSVGASVVFGLAISVASTVVTIRMLSDSEALHTPAGHTAVGWLVIEDILTVLVLVLLPIVAGRGAGGSGWDTALAIGLALLKVGGLVAFTLVVGQRLIPVVLRFVSRLRSRELFTLTVLVIALGIAIGSAKLFGVSMALGAFLAGMVVGQSEFSARAASDALPMRDAFAVLFFVAMGMLLDPGQLLPNAGLIGGSLAVILVVTPLVTLLVARLLGAPHRTALTLALGLAQIGEFSFILATMGRQLGVLPERATQCLVAASIVTITLNPLLFRLMKPGVDVAPAATGAELHRTIVVGYGPVGRTLAAMLRENAIEPTIVEMNEATVARLAGEGWSAVHGDASTADVLERAGVRAATGLIFAASGSPEPVVRLAREMNPTILVLARTTFVADVAAMQRAGANAVISAEGAVALAMVERMLQRLGATADQLDRARDRVREEMGHA